MREQGGGLSYKTLSDTTEEERHVQTRKPTAQCRARLSTRPTHVLQREHSRSWELLTLFVHLVCLELKGKLGFQKQRRPKYWFNSFRMSSWKEDGRIDICVTTNVCGIVNVVLSYWLDGWMSGWFDRWLDGDCARVWSRKKQMKHKTITKHTKKKSTFIRRLIGVLSLKDLER